MARSERGRRHPGRGLLLVGLCALYAPVASAGQHTWDVNEVFSSANGNVQFVELWEANGTPGEIGVGNQTVSSSSHSFPMGAGAVASPTTHKHFLLGTAAFAALPGAPTPDVIIPAGFLPYFFNPAGDTVTYGPYDSWAFGSVPTNGTDSLDRISGVGPNTPTNYAGVTGSVDASGPPSIPATPGPIALIVVGGLLFAGVVSLLRTRQHAA